ncbi:hypothetical protein V8E55_008651 [Tylopilus felleus]
MAEVVILTPDGQNWSKWRKFTQTWAEKQRVAKYLVGTPPNPFSEVRDGLLRRTIECTTPKSISKHFRHYATAREYVDYLTEQFDKPPRQQTGETPHGSVNKGTAAAKGPGKTTTDPSKTDGVSLVTTASGPLPPRDDRGDHAKVYHQTVVLTTPPIELTIPTTTQQADDTAADIANPYATCAEPTRPAGTSRTPPDEVELPEPLWEVADDEAESWEGVDEECHAHTKRVDTDDKECRAHAKHIDEQPRRVKTSEDEATTIIPRAPESTSSRGREADIRASTSDLPRPMRTRREYLDVMRTLGTCGRSWGKRQ